MKTIEGGKYFTNTKTTTDLKDTLPIWVPELHATINRLKLLGRNSKSRVTGSNQLTTLDCDVWLSSVRIAKEVVTGGAM